MLPLYLNMNTDVKNLFDGMKDSLGSDFFEKLNEDLREVSAQVEADMRKRESQLQEFIAAGERNIDKINSVIDRLFVFIDDGLAEDIIRKYIAYIETFNPSYAQKRLDELEEKWGYKSVIVYAAGIMAHSFGCLWNGCDKGNSSFNQLLKQMKDGLNWKEKVALFILYTSKNSKCSITELMNMLNLNTQQLMNVHESNWWQSWMDDLTDNDALTTHPLTLGESDEIISLIHRYIQNG